MTPTLRLALHAAFIAWAALTASLLDIHSQTVAADPPESASPESASPERAAQETGPADIKTVTEVENVAREAEQPPAVAPLPAKEVVEGTAKKAPGNPTVEAPHLPRTRTGQSPTNQTRTGAARPALEKFAAPNPDGGYLGVELNREFPEAAIVARVLPGTAAEQAGLQVGDRIWGVNNQRVETASDLIVLLGQITPGENVEIQYDRAHRATIALGHR